MTHERLLPNESLAACIAHFWTVTWDLDAPYEVETLPHPSVHVTFERDRGAELAQVGGVATGRFVRTLKGQGFVFGVKLRPGAFASFFDTSVSDITDRRVPLDALFGAAGVDLSRAMFATTTLSERIDLAEAFLVPRVRPLSLEAARIRDLVERMSTDRSLVRVDQVALAAGLEVRTLERAFARYVGVSPKWVLRRYRLHEAAETLRAAGAPSLVSLALSLGYSDQAHFARDFREVVGLSPRAFMRGAPL